MATGQMSEALERLRGAVLLRDGAGLTDAQLLDDYVRRRDEAALAALVRRHGPMVWGVCRRVLHDHHDAEDAFQAAFLVLVRKAASIASRELLASWLYGVAHQTALKARATAARRKGRERQVSRMPEPAVVEQDVWPDLQPLLDEELSRLPDRYRAVIVLSDLEGKTRKEAAALLGVPEGTVAGWLSRARAMLARRLTRRGVALSGGALAATLSGSAASAGVPAPVVSSTIEAAALFGSGQAARGAISAKVTALTEGVLKAMLLKSLKTASVLLLAVAFLGAGTAGLLYRTRAAEPATAQPARAPKKDTAKADTEKIQGTWRLMKLELNGVELPFAFLQAREGSLAVFAGDRWTTNFLEGKGFKFKLDPKQKPKALDLQPLGDTKETLLGIYRLEGDDLTICYGKTGKQERPTAFENYWAAGTYTVLIVLKRENAKGKAAASKKAAANTDKEALQGTWVVASTMVDGKPVPKEELNVEKKLTIAGDRWATTEAKLGRVGAGTYTIDPAKKPKSMDMTVEEGAEKGTTYRMIYKVEGDTLTICEGRDEKRPTAFTSTAEGPNRRLAVLKREKGD